MERGFDKLMTPEGIAMVTAFMFFTLAFIVLGGTWVKLHERKKKIEREEKRDE